MPEFNLKQIGWKKLEKPSPLFQVLRRTEDKDKIIAHEFMNGFLNLDDNFRNYESIYRSMNFYFNYTFSIFYEIGRDNKFQALLGITNIIPQHKADIMLKIFDKAFWRKDFIRESRAILKLLIKEFRLKRISTESCDPRVVKLAKMCGFKVEGIRNKDLRWDGKYYDNFLLGMEE